MTILEDMEVEAIKSDAVDSLGDAREQLKKLIKMERISIAATAAVAIAAIAGMTWLIPAAGLTAPTALLPPQTAAAKKLTEAQRKHLILLLWTQAAKNGGIIFFTALVFLFGIASGFLTSGTSQTTYAIIVVIFIFMLYRSFSKIRFYKKTLKHVAVQQNNLS